MWRRAASVVLALALAGLAMAVPGDVDHARAQAVTLEELGSAVLQIKTHVHPHGRTVETLGAERE
ncbi:MAG: hypothetical protein M3N38_01945, partial [Pseudomonadota bacterium]|nr:hypothetical protein [Pseudomonadota bacterium]